MINRDDVVYYLALFITKAPQILFAFTLGILMHENALAISLLLLYMGLEIYGAFLARSSEESKALANDEAEQDMRNTLNIFNSCPKCHQQNVTLSFIDTFNNGNEQLRYSAHCNHCGYDLSNYASLEDLSSAWVAVNDRP